jgi:hypothetical protein
MSMSFHLLRKKKYIYILANFRHCGQAILNNRNECGLQRRHLFILIRLRNTIQYDRTISFTYSRRMSGHSVSNCMKEDCKMVAIVGLHGRLGLHKF